MCLVMNYFFSATIYFVFTICVEQTVKLLYMLLPSYVRNISGMHANITERLYCTVFPLKNLCFVFVVRVEQAVVDRQEPFSLCSSLLHMSLLSHSVAL